MTASALLLRPTGALDWDHCDDLRQQLATAFATGVQSIAVDLSAVSDADVTGLQVLAGAARHLRKRGGALIVTGASPQVTSLLRVNGLGNLLQVPPSQPLRVVASGRPRAADRAAEGQRDAASGGRHLRVVSPDSA